MNFTSLLALAAVLLLAIVCHFGSVEAGEKGDKIILGVGKKGHKDNHGYGHGYGHEEHGYGHHKKCNPALIVKKGMNN